jgi:hypothetical protein
MVALVLQATMCYHATCIQVRIASHAHLTQAAQGKHVTEDLYTKRPYKLNHLTGLMQNTIFAGE